MKKILAKALVLCMTLMMIVPSTALADTVGNDAISIVFSHDMHSHLEKFAKIKTVIDGKKKENAQTFVFDAGDFSMGTPFQTIFKQEASELRMMGAVGYDATTFGNHEFDYRSKGLAKMLRTAKTSKDKVPALVISNIDWEKTLGEEALRADGENLQNAMNEYGVNQTYQVFVRGGVKVAVFGIFGKESASYAPESGTYFKDPVETARAVVEQIESKEEADLIVCISHSGTSANPEASEDEILAESVDGIDLIISGHSHTEFSQPIIKGDTVIASCGQYNEKLGAVTFVKKGDDYQLDDYELIPLDNKIKENKKTADAVNKFKKLADRKYFNLYGYSWDQTLVSNPVDFTGIDVFGQEQGEDALGNLIADSYVYGVRRTEGKNYVPVDVAVAPAGVIRGSFSRGRVTVADAFNALSLGTGKDGVAGYPLVSVYLTGDELKLAAEIDISVSEIMSPARLYFSGLTYTYNPNRLILNRAFDIKVLDEEGNTTEPESDKLYRVVADLYSAQMLGTVNSMSYGLLSVVPKDKNGVEITDFEDHIIYDKNGSELKEWYALASYLDSMDPQDITEKYGVPEGRKVLEDSKTLEDIFKKPNKFFRMMIAAAILVIAIIALILVLIVKLIKRLRYGKNPIRKKDMMFSRR